MEDNKSIFRHSIEYAYLIYYHFLSHFVKAIGSFKVCETISLSSSFDHLYTEDLGINLFSKYQPKFSPFYSTIMALAPDFKNNRKNFGKASCFEEYSCHVSLNMNTYFEAIL